MREGKIMITRLSTEKLRVLDKDRRIIRHIGTNEMPDSYNSILRDDGWKNLSAYLAKNPVFFWAHETRTMPIGRTVAITPTTVKGRDLRGREAVYKGRFFDVEYPDKKTYPFGHQVYRMYKAGFLRGTSVGFDPHENGVLRVSEEKELDRLGLRAGSAGEVFTAMDLKEYSAAPLPGNSEALTAQLAGFAQETRLAYRVRMIDPLDPKLEEWFAETMLALKNEIDRAGGSPTIRTEISENASNLGSVTVEIDDKGEPKVVKREPPAAPKVEETDATTEEGAEPDLVLSPDAIASLGDLFHEDQEEAEVEVYREAVVVQQGDTDAFKVEEIRVIVKKGEKFCVMTEDRKKTLGCHPTIELAKAQLGAVEANKKKVAKTLEELRTMILEAKDGETIDATQINARMIDGLHIRSNVAILLGKTEEADPTRQTLVNQVGADAEPEGEPQDPAETWRGVLEAFAQLDEALVAHARVLGEAEPDETEADGDEPKGDDGAAPPGADKTKKPPAPIAAKASPEAEAIRAELKRFFLDLDLPTRGDLQRLEAEIDNVRELAGSGRGKRGERLAPPPMDAIAQLAESSLASMKRTAEALDDLLK